jgi:hypothetical protein
VSLRACSREPEYRDVENLQATMRLKWIVLAAAAAAAPVVPAFGAKQAEMVLTCTNLVSGAKWLVKVNFENSTVDSNPARISDTEISWHDAAGGGNYTLDRKTGSLTVVFASSTGGYSINDRCAPRN